MKRFNPKDYPVNVAFDVEPIYIDDVALVERIGPTVHVSFAAVSSEQYSATEWRKKRQVKVKLILLAERWKAIINQLKLGADDKPDLSAMDFEEMTAH